MATIHYPFHPRRGEEVGVWRRHSFRGVTMLVVQQADGTLAQVPEWMCAQAAAAAVVRDVPRFPLRVLRELRLTADGAVALLSDDGGGRDGTSRATRTTGPVRGSAGGAAAGARDAPGAAGAAGGGGGRGDDGSGGR